MIRPIVIWGRPPSAVLALEAEPVTAVDDAVRQVMADLRETMLHGVPLKAMGLAAPQIGVSLRVIAVLPTQSAREPVLLANPRIVQRSGRHIAGELCLSVPREQGLVARALACTVTGVGTDGRQLRLEAAGRIARCIQHEIDHLNGMLWTARAIPGSVQPVPEVALAD